MYVIVFRFPSGVLGVACQKEGCFSMLMVEGNPGDEVLAKDVFGFKTIEEAETYLDEMRHNPAGKKLLDHFEGRYSVTLAKEVMVQ